MASSSNSSATEKEKSSAPEKEESSSNSSEPKIMMSSSDPSLIIPEVSASTSASEMRFKYDVFLSFRGEDTRNNFVGHLYQALQRNSIETYKDDEKIDKGERINDNSFKS
ncbi:Toll/interleukin-1 receptor domain-containing protein [Tanacetum coccineum]